MPGRLQLGRQCLARLKDYDGDIDRSVPAVASSRREVKKTGLPANKAREVF
jgi:hypothetical protein